MFPGQVQNPPLIICVPPSPTLRKNLGDFRRCWKRRARAPSAAEIPLPEPLEDLNVHGSVIWGVAGTNLLKPGSPDLVHREPDIPTGLLRILQRKRTRERERMSERGRERMNEPEREQTEWELTHALLEAAESQDLPS